MTKNKSIYSELCDAIIGSTPLKKKEMSDVDKLRKALKAIVYCDELIDDIIEADRDRDKKVWDLINQGREALDATN